jgi:hypothetical protein
MDAYKELRWKEWLFRISLVLTILSSVSLVTVLYFKIQLHIKSFKPCRMEAFEYGLDFPGRNCYCIGRMVPSIRVEDSPSSSICKGIGLSWENRPEVSKIFFLEEDTSQLP